MTDGEANHWVLAFCITAIESATDICDGSARQRSSTGTVIIEQVGALWQTACINLVWFRSSEMTPNQMWFREHTIGQPRVFKFVKC